MISIKNKVLYIVSSHDCGSFVILDSLKNTPEVLVVDSIEDVVSTSHKYILLNSEIPVTHILRKIDNVLPIFFFRDVRVAWLITEHKSKQKTNTKTIEQYIKNFNILMALYTRVVNEQDALVFKFEDFLMDKRTAYMRLCRNLDLKYNQSHISSLLREKTSMLSLNDIEKVIRFQKDVTDDQLSYISSKTKEYNKFFNYPYNLSKNDILERL